MVTEEFVAEAAASTEVVLGEVKGGTEVVFGGFKTGWDKSLVLGLADEAEGTVDGETDGLAVATTFPAQRYRYRNMFTSNIITISITNFKYTSKM